MFVEQPVWLRMQHPCRRVPDDLIDPDDAAESASLTQTLAIDVFRRHTLRAAVVPLVGRVAQCNDEHVAADGRWIDVSVERDRDERPCAEAVKFVQNADVIAVRLLDPQSGGSGRFTRRRVRFSSSGTVNRSDGKGLPFGEPRSNSGCAALPVGSLMPCRTRGTPKTIDVQTNVDATSSPAAARRRFNEGATASSSCSREPQLAALLDSLARKNPLPDGRCPNSVKSATVEVWPYCGPGACSTLRPAVAAPADQA